MTVLFHHLFRDNPVLGYLSRRAWRRYRRWGWALSILPLTIIVWYLLFQGIHALHGPPTGQITPSTTAAIVSGMTMAALFVLIAAFSTREISRLLRQENLESIFLTSLSPAQIWVAIMVNLNRNLLVLTSLSLPLLLPMATLGHFPKTFLISHALWLWALANIWALLVAVSVLQIGPSLNCIRSAVVISAFIVIGSSFLTEELLRNRVGRPNSMPMIFALNPFPYWLSEARPVLKELDSGFPQSSPRLCITVLGWNAPLWPVTMIFSGALAGILSLWLLVGPMRIPTMRNIAGDRRGTEGKTSLLARMAGLPFFSLVSPNRYKWRRTTERLYENSPEWLKRHRCLFKTIVSGAAWTMAVIILADLTQLLPKRALTPGPNSVLTSLMAVALLGLLAGFHFACPGAAPKFPGESRPIWPRLAWRSRAYSFKMAIVIIAFWTVGASRATNPKLPGIDWLFRPDALLAPAFVLLALTAQNTFQIWASSRSTTNRAIMAGMIHAMAVWMLPLTLFLVAFWLPDSLAWCVELASLSPVVGLADTVNDLSISLPRSPGIGGSIAWEARWGCSVAFLLGEIAIFESLLIRDRIGDKK